MTHRSLFADTFLSRRFYDTAARHPARQPVPPQPDAISDTDHLPVDEPKRSHGIEPPEPDELGSDDGPLPFSPSPNPRQDGAKFSDPHTPRGDGGIYPTPSARNVVCSRACMHGATMVRVFPTRQL